MSARFRIRTPQGQELSFASQAVFVEFIRSGELAPEDLVYDGETNEWAPARTHPLVLEIQYERDAESERPAARETGPESAAHAPDSEGGGATLDGLGLDLAPPVEGPSPEEEAAAFLKKMEAERAMDLDAPADLGGLEIVMEDSSSLGDMISGAGAPPSSGAARAPEPPSSSAPPGKDSPERERRPSRGKARRPPPPVTGEPGRSRTSEKRSSPRRPERESAPPGPSSSSPPHEAAPRPAARPTEASPRRASKARKTTSTEAHRKAARANTARGGRGALKLVLLIVVAAVVAVGVYFVTSLVEGPGIADPPDAEAASLPPRATPRPMPRPAAVTPDAEAGPQPGGAVAGATPVLPATPEAVGARAHERFLTTTQGFLRDLEPIPDAWLSGEYFTLPSDYQGVRNTWQEYLATARRVRAGDEVRYRAAYERALDEAAVVGEVRQTRLGAAMDAFAAHADARRAHWDRVESLALAAIQSHDALVEAEGLVLFDDSGITGRPRGIGAGVSGRDSDTQLLLTQVIELLGARLAADGHGPREPANVREWLWGGFLDAVTH